jgi:hypothetical protein
MEGVTGNRQVIAPKNISLLNRQDAKDAKILFSWHLGVESL